MYIILAFMVGISIVLNMVLNGKLSQKEGMINSIWINYFTAILITIFLCIIFENTIPDDKSIKSIPLIYFIGGCLGVLTTYLFNLIVHKVPALYIVILRFIGQLLTSALIDYLYFHIFSRGKILGGILFFVGLMLNAKMDERQEEKKLKSATPI
jgi:uncharacterized membrane protein YdcZ (DUF606 family)